MLDLMILIIILTVYKICKCSFRFGDISRFRQIKQFYKKSDKSTKYIFYNDL